MTNGIQFHEHPPVNLYGVHTTVCRHEQAFPTFDSKALQECVGNSGGVRRGQETQRHKGTEAQRKPASNGPLMPVFFVPLCLCVSVANRNSSLDFEFLCAVSEA